MKASEIIAELQKIIKERGDGEVQFGVYSGDVDTSKYYETAEITLENENFHYIVIWDR